MRKFMFRGIAIVAVLAGVVGGYRLGAGHWPNWHSILLFAPSDRGEKTVASGAAPAERAILYWKHPDGEADFSPSQKKTVDGRERARLRGPGDRLQRSERATGCQGEEREAQNPLLPQSHGPA